MVEPALFSHRPQEKSTTLFLSPINQGPENFLEIMQDTLTPQLMVC